eukprot:8494309-Pyramimonas_sp.AAC.1
MQDDEAKPAAALAPHLPGVNLLLSGQAHPGDRLDARGAHAGAPAESLGVVEELDDAPLLHLVFVGAIEDLLELGIDDLNLVPAGLQVGQNAVRGDLARARGARGIQALNLKSADPLQEYGNQVISARGDLALGDERKPCVAN